jgi:Protein of unknown function (DUF4240)
MTEDEFWALIETIDNYALEQGDEESALAPLSGALSERPESDLFGFEEILSQKLYALDGEDYASRAGESGVSSDGFLYIRCYIIARGKGYYQNILAATENMPNSIDQWCESLLYVHRHVWAKLTDNDESEWPFKASVSYETFSNKVLWAKDQA